MFLVPFMPSDTVHSWFFLSSRELSPVQPPLPDMNKVGREETPSANAQLDTSGEKPRFLHTPLFRPKMCRKGFTSGLSKFSCDGETASSYQYIRTLLVIQLSLAVRHVLSRLLFFRKRNQAARRIAVS